MGGAGIEQFRGGDAERSSQTDGLSRRIVRQAQHDEIAFRHHVLPRRRILTLRCGQAA